ncbi:hypothetical protein [Glycomyces harbinensis]|uniref:Transglycosylase SLT domain-containing protein n=1 Tax=Glycomyces harbinensis TaxID=58114 RepID=A0A1G7CUR7_9ACTN|nr:hypothetical protein [Glycomyces harbinensis]SDE43057.1 hypothetical protein SAMN05216270_12144 [Glycomyces harbinensis]
MIPLLTRYGAKLAAVLVLALGAVIAVNAVTDDPSELDAQHPSQAAAEQQAEAEAAYEEVRYLHVNYIEETAGADVATKVDALADFAADRAASLDSAQEDADQAAEEAEQAAEEAANAGRTDVDIPGSCGDYSGNKATGCALAQEHGFDLEQVGCLVALWDRESGWNELAANGIGAYGIPQALPGSKMESEGSDWETNPVTQIEWGLGYIEGRYGTPCEAWNHSEEVGWY